MYLQYKNRLEKQSKFFFRKRNTEEKNKRDSHFICDILFIYLNIETLNLGITILINMERENILKICYNFFI